MSTSLLSEAFHQFHLHKHQSVITLKPLMSEVNNTYWDPSSVGDNRQHIKSQFLMLMCWKQKTLSNLRTAKLWSARRLCQSITKMAGLRGVPGEFQGNTSGRDLFLMFGIYLFWYSWECYFDSFMATVFLTGTGLFQQDKVACHMWKMFRKGLRKLLHVCAL